MENIRTNNLDLFFDMRLSEEDRLTLLLNMDAVVQTIFPGNGIEAWNSLGLHDSEEPQNDFMLFNNCIKAFKLFMVKRNNIELANDIINKSYEELESAVNCLEIISEYFIKDLNIALADFKTIQCEKDSRLVSETDEIQRRIILCNAIEFYVRVYGNVFENSDNLEKYRGNFGTANKLTPFSLEDGSYMTQYQFTLLVSAVLITLFRYEVIPKKFDATKIMSHQVLHRISDCDVTYHEYIDSVIDYIVTNIEFIPDNYFDNMKPKLVKGFITSIHTVLTFFLNDDEKFNVWSKMMQGDSEADLVDLVDKITESEDVKRYIIQACNTGITLIKDITGIEV